MHLLGKDGRDKSLKSSTFFRNTICKNILIAKKILTQKFSCVYRPLTVPQQARIIAGAPKNDTVNTHIVTNTIT